MIKIGLLGNGGITKSHRASFELMRQDGIDIQVVAVADIRPEMTANCEGERVYRDYAELLEAEQGNLDYVLVALPTFLHAPASIKAMELGYNVLCEKPMAINYEAALEMCETAKRTGKTLMVAHSVRFSYVNDVLREWIKSERLGKIVTACSKRDNGTPMNSWEHWFLNKERSGGAILDLHMHDVNALEEFFGMPEAVTTGAVNTIPGSGYDIASTIYHYGNGFYTTSTVSWATPHQKYGNDGKTYIFENGYIYYGTFEGKTVFVAVDKDGNTTELTPAVVKPSYYCEHKYFIECITQGKPVERCTPESSANCVKIVMAEMESASKNGARITLGL